MISPYNKAQAEGRERQFCPEAESVESCDLPAISISWVGDSG